VRPVDVAAVAASAESAVGANGLAARVAMLEEEVAQLREIVTDLATQLGLSPPGHTDTNERA
jgi:uncharacterized protein YceH (UPF0502 family)